MNAFLPFVLLTLCLVTKAVNPQGLPPPGEGDQAVAVNPRFSQQELDQMLAPVALYPDGLLSQILMAATYPLEVVEAARWSSAHPALDGIAAGQAVSDQNWDPSVKSLVAVPQVLQVLDARIDWTQRLGDAFLAQRSEVMDTIQRLRARARAAGNLQSSGQLNVVDEGGEIQLSEPDPQRIYVPYYDPSLVYGTWWWAGYPPVFWSPWAGYGWAGPFAWGIGIGVGADFFFGSWDWRRHAVFGRDGGSRRGAPWQFEGAHRHGVPFRDPALNHQFARSASVAPAQGEFRGHEHARAAGIAGGGAVGGSAGSPPGNRAAAPDRLQPPQHTGNPARGLLRMAPASRDHAFEDVGRGEAVRAFSARGQAAVAGRQAAGGGHASGGGQAAGSGHASRGGESAGGGHHH